MPTAPPAPGVFRRGIGVVAGCAVLALLGWQFKHMLTAGPGWIPVDFMAFWTAGKLHIEGRNAYDQAAVRAIQTSEVAGVGEAVMMWNPPWALAVVAPLGLLPVPAAATLWLLLLLVLVVFAADLIWRTYSRSLPRLGGGNQTPPVPSPRWLACLLALTPAPTIYLFAYGQLTAIPLLGVGGFLACVKAKRFFWAGVFGGLTASKPHLFSLFALAILFEAIRTREGRTILLGGLCLGTVTTILVSLPNPHVWADYWAATQGPGSELHRSLGEWEPPLIGWYLRQIIPGKPFAAQFVPLGVTASAFTVVWWKHRTNWDWLAAMPWVVGASLLVAPYGAWAHDGVLLLVPILAAAVRFDPWSNWARLGLILYILANAAGYATYLAHATGETYVWLNPAILVACRLTGRAARRQPAGNFESSEDSLLPAGLRHAARRTQTGEPAPAEVATP
jgi:hypothetical protein